jgi:hypothetical protein
MTEPAAAGTANEEDTMTINTIDLRTMIQVHVRTGDALNPELDGLELDELLDVFAIASEEWAIVSDMMAKEDGSLSHSFVTGLSARLARATELRRRARDLLLPLLNPQPR